jgi:hypothetical protein
MGDVLVWAPNETAYLAGRGQRAVVIGNRTVVPEGKARGVKMVVAKVEDQEEVLAYKDLWEGWETYHRKHEEARRAARDAMAVANGILARLVAHEVTEAPPSDEELGRAGSGGVDYWMSPVRYRRRPDQTPIGVEIVLDNAAAGRLLAILPEAP